MEKNRCIYISIYKNSTMQTVKIIKNGGSQAIRIPRLYRLKGKEAYDKKKCRREFC